MNKTHYIVDVNLKEIHDGSCPKLQDKTNTLDLDERNDAEIFCDKLGFSACETCRPQVGNEPELLTGP